MDQTNVMEPLQPAAPTDDMLDYNKFKIRAQKILKDWDSNVTNTAVVHRNMRKIKVDVVSLQTQGKLKVDETIIPIRVIDNNIKTEQPLLIRYIKQSPRLAVFKCIDNPQVDASQKKLLEEEFTNVLSYNGWEKWVFRLVEGAQLHGFCCAEVEFDPSKPGHVNITAYPNEDVIFPIKAKELEFQPFIMIRRPITVFKLTEIAAKYGFDMAQVNLLTEKYKDKQESDEEVNIYKALIKSDGIVKVAWLTFEDPGNSWLKAPEPLFIGRAEQKMSMQVVPDMATGLAIPQEVATWVDIPETMYPVKLYRYQETEDQLILETEGRAYQDAPVQEAMTALFSSFVNSAVRASNVYGSPKQGKGGNVNKLDVTLEHGCIYSEPVEFFSTGFPTFDLIRGAQALQTQKQIESGQIASATMNRADTRKLAKELEMAEEKTDMLSSIPVTNFGIFLTELFTHAWSVIQSRALQNKFPFAQIQNPMTGAYENNMQLLSYTYQLRPAGDSDVVKREERKKRRLETLQVAQMILQSVAAAPLTATFFVEYAIDYLKENLPEDATKYEAILRQLLQQQQQMMMLQMQQQAANPQQEQPNNEPNSNLQ